MNRRLSWQAVTRFWQWYDDGIFDQILTRLHLRLREDDTMDLDTWMVDSTAIMAIRSASGASKQGWRWNRRIVPSAVVVAG